MYFRGYFMPVLNATHSAFKCSLYPDLLFSAICVIFLALPTPFTLVPSERRIQLFIFCFDTKRQNKSEWAKVRMHAICFFKQFPLKFKTLKCSNVSSFTWSGEACFLSSHGSFPLEALCNLVNMCIIHYTVYLCVCVPLATSHDCWNVAANCFLTLW